MNRRLLSCLLVPAGLLLAGCANHEKTIHERAQQLVVHLVQANYDACVQLADPRFVQQKGTEGTKGRFQILGLFVKLGNLKVEDVRIDQVTVGEGAQTATVTLSIRAGQNWTPLGPQRWSRVDGQWYFTPDG